VNIAFQQERVSREFRERADEFRKFGDEAVALWGELDRQGRKLPTCPNLSLLVEKTQNLWAHAAHYAGYHSLVSDPPDQSDRYHLKESCAALRRLRQNRSASSSELRALVVRAADEVRRQCA
jgi:hypothetical protein